MVKEKFRNRGLPTLNEAAVDRRRQLVSGRAKVGAGIPPKLFLWGLVVLIVGGLLYFRAAQAELEEQRQAILLKQRATEKLLSPRLLPLRTKVEEFAKQLARPDPDQVDPSVDWKALLASPGVYLRARKIDVSDSAKLRAAGNDSLRDGFTSCAFSDKRAQPPTSGIPCKQSTDCETGQHCNEFHVCRRPVSPYNMRLLYRALEVLSPKWVQEVEDTNSDYKLLALERSLEAVTQVDIPIAIEVGQRAKFAAVVVDEEPEAGLPKANPGAFESESERLQRTAHFATVGIWDLQADKLLARVRAEASGSLRSAGTRTNEASPGAGAALARQANNCALALAFKQRVLPAGYGAAHSVAP
jgi:hypothetical protein